MKICFGVFFSKIFRENSKFHWNLTRITGSLYDDLCTFMIIHRRIRLRNGNVSAETLQIKSTLTLYSETFSPKIVPLWDNAGKYGTVRQGTGDNITGRRRIACWINKATNTHSEYVVLITFHLQQCLREHASVPRLYYIARLVQCLWQKYIEVSMGLAWAVS